MITPGFADGEGDTTCIPALQHFVKALHENGVEVTIFALHYPYRSTEYRWHGVRVIPLNGANSRLKRLFSLKRRLRKLFSEIHLEQPFTRIHAFWLNEAAVWSVQLGQFFHLPVTATAMGQDVLPENSYLSKPELKSLQRIVTLSPSHRDHLLKQTGLSSELIHWGLPAKTISDAERTIDLIGVGNLIPLKDYDYFLQICACLKNEHPQFNAVIVGTGPEKQQLIKRIHAFGLGENVVLEGQKSYEETQELIRSSKILLHPSHYESFGMVVIEALASGTAVFARNTGIAGGMESVWLLSGDANADAKRVMTVLNAPHMENVFFDIQSTITAYRTTVFRTHTDK